MEKFEKSRAVTSRVYGVSTNPDDLQVTLCVSGDSDLPFPYGLMNDQEKAMTKSFAAYWLSKYTGETEEEAAAKLDKNVAVKEEPVEE